MAFVHSVLLYNCEVLNIAETEMKALVGRNGYLMRKLAGEAVRSVDDKRLTESQVLEMLGLESIQSLIRKRKLQWVAHCARTGEDNLMEDGARGRGWEESMGNKIEGRLEGIGSQVNGRMVQQGQG